MPWEAKATRLQPVAQTVPVTRAGGCPVWQRVPGLGLALCGVSVQRARTHAQTHTTRPQEHLVAAGCCRVNVRQLSLRGWSRHTTLQPQGATAVRGARQPPPRHQLAVCGERRSGMAACASTRVCSEALVNTWAGTRSTNSGWVAPSVDHSAWTGSHHGSSNAKLKLRGRGTG